MPLEKVRILIESTKEAKAILLTDAAGTLVTAIGASFSKDPGKALKQFSKLIADG